MVETIESFVEKLQSEGVQAGHDAAEEIKNEARQQAQEIINEARSQAEKILADARKEAEAIVSKSQSELKLASRDAILGLRQSVIATLKTVLTGPVEQKLDDPEFLAPMLHDLVVEYARADLDRGQRFEIHVKPEVSKQLAEWVIRKLRKTAETNQATIDFKGHLKQAGFEYKVSGATVDVTVESVVETLLDMVSDNLKDILREAAGEVDETSK
ncbi:MAG: hypothetical protein JW860_13900 [Sedimentisphaerales bacterium]|nr:hypothetical protein [Sedimentisphaerales bacterium]